MHLDSKHRGIKRLGAVEVRNGNIEPHEAVVTRVEVAHRGYLRFRFGAPSMEESTGRGFYDGRRATAKKGGRVIRFLVRMIGITSTVLAAFAVLTCAQAQDYPTHPIRVIVPFAT